MPQAEIWEREYQNPQLLTKGAVPRSDVKRFVKFLRKIEDVDLQNLTILDLGSGTGRNAIYLAEMGNRVVGLEISNTAIEIAKSRTKESGVDVKYQIADIGSKYPFDNESFDIVLDVMTSNSLNEKERAIYLSEVHRVLKQGGYFFVRALCKDGDKNARNLLKKCPGREHDTYINEDMELTERVFSRDDFVGAYSRFFKILKLTKKTNYAKFNGQNYKRNYWLANMKKVNN